MSLLRETVRLRDESTRSRAATSPGHQSAVSVLLADVHQEQYRQTAYCARAQSRDQHEGLAAVQRFGLGHCAPVTMSSASLSLSPSSPRSPSWSTCGGTGSNSSGDHFARADRETGPRLDRTRREERLQLSTFVFPSSSSANAVPIPRRESDLSACAPGIVEKSYTRGTTMKIRMGQRNMEEARNNDAHGASSTLAKTLRITKLVNESATVK